MKLTNSIKDKIDDYFDNLTPEDIKKLKEKYFPESNIPKGWVSIEDDLPYWKGINVEQGYTVWKIKYSDGSEAETRVTDHDLWYHLAKESGVTHWWND